MTKWISGISRYMVLVLLLCGATLSCLFLFYDNHLNECLSFLNELQYSRWPDNIYYFSLLFIVATLLFIPIGLPLNLFAGMLWGTFLGALIVNILSIFVASISFLLARVVNHFWAGKHLNRIGHFNKFREMLDRNDWKFIFVIRINPIAPFAISNFLLGFITQLSFKRFIIITGICNMLPCLAFASIGSMFQTFYLNEKTTHNFYLNLLITMLLLSLLLSLKWFFPKFEKS